ncbi:MAG: restriction endonuclease subunit S, partial [Oscillospiraceae bacterium]
MKRYAEYKDSGIEWIGSAPIEWSICTLKRVVNLKTDKVDFIGQNYMGLENVESHTGRYVKSGSQEVEGLSTSFQRGDVLFGKLRPYLAKCIIPEFSGICSSEFLVLRNFNVARKYLQYFLLSSQLIEAINASTYGAKMPLANWSYIGQMQIPVPPTPVQQSIVAYLDRKTAAIDTLIADKQKL